MSVDLPELGSTTYDELLAEARRRLVRFAPEWTDFNPGDPGTVLVELFCWLTETLLHETARMPELAHAKFLELVGLRQRPAVPAVADLLFTPMPNTTGVVVPRGTRASATAPDGAPIVFETQELLALIPHPLRNVLSRTTRGEEAILAPDRRSPQPFRPFGCVPRIGDAVYLGFEVRCPEEGLDGAAGELPPRVHLHVAVPDGAFAAAGAGTLDPEVGLVWEYQEEDGRWRQLRVLHDDTGGLTRSGYVVLVGSVQLPPTLVGDVTDPRYWLRCRIDSGDYFAGHVPVVRDFLPNTVRAVQLVTEHDEALGVSEGHPGETYRLLRTPVAEGTVVLEVRSDRIGDERWTEQHDLLASTSDDRHFALDPATGRITFGDGRRGRVPPADGEVVAVAYRAGGGAVGNVEAGAIITVLAELPSVASVTNTSPATGGADRQTLADLEREAARVLRHRWRAVTADDYADITRDVPGVADAYVLAARHPDQPTTPAPGVVTVVVAAIPAVGGPAVGVDLLAKVKTELDERRLIATELHVRSVEVVTVDVTVTVIADLAHRNRDAMEDEVRRRVKAILSPQRGALFRQALPDQALRAAVDHVPGVVSAQVRSSSSGRPPTLPIWATKGGKVDVDFTGGA